MVALWYPSFEMVIWQIHYSKECQPWKLRRNLPWEEVAWQVQGLQLSQVTQWWRDLTKEVIMRQVEDYKWFENPYLFRNFSMETIVGEIKTCWRDQDMSSKESWLQLHIAFGNEPGNWLAWRSRVIRVSE